MRIKTASGEVFTSIDEMERSGNSYIRGLAQSMRLTREMFERKAAEVFNKKESAA